MGGFPKPSWPSYVRTCATTDHYSEKISRSARSGAALAGGRIERASVPYELFQKEINTYLGLPHPTRKIREPRVLFQGFQVFHRGRCGRPDKKRENQRSPFKESCVDLGCTSRHSIRMSRTTPADISLLWPTCSIQSSGSFLGRGP